MKYEIDYVRVYQKIKEPYTVFYPGQIWEDTDGNHINAHGEVILYRDGKYYWYGEHKSEHTSSALVGVRVYSSTDLYNWKNEGVALSVEAEGSGHLLEKGCIIERPKVVYNEKTKKYVMWFHLRTQEQGLFCCRIWCISERQSCRTIQVLVFKPFLQGTVACKHDKRRNRQGKEYRRYRQKVKKTGRRMLQMVHGWHEI